MFLLGMGVGVGGGILQHGVCSSVVCVLAQIQPSISMFAFTLSMYRLHNFICSNFLPSFTFSLQLVLKSGAKFSPTNVIEL